MTDLQKQKLPEELRTLLDRFHQEPILLNKVRSAMRIAAQHVAQKSMNQETFCDTFSPPYKLVDVLLGYFGMTEKELKASMVKVGFILNSMYTEIYYQVFCIVYLIGLEFSDENLRKMALLMIDIRLWNGRKMKFFKYCDPDVARYTLSYVLRNHHTLKKMGTPFKYFDEFSIPAVDKKYSISIPNNLSHDKEGLMKLITTNFSRIQGIFFSMQKAYYKTYKEGKKEIVSGKYKNQYGEGDLVETRESFSGVIERLVDKLQKNAMLRKNILLNPDAKRIFYDKFMLSESKIRKFNDWLEDEDNHEEIKYFFEYVFTSFKPKDESDICKFDIEVLANRITGAKKDPDLLKAKEIINHMLISILGDKHKTLTPSSMHLARRLVAFTLMIYAKMLLCKKV